MGSRTGEPPVRELLLYLGARLGSTLGSQVQSVAIGWEVYAWTGKALDLGWVGLAQFLPMALLSLYAGNVADRFDRRRILIACRSVYALGALALAFMARNHSGGLAGVYAVLVVLGSARAFGSPAAVALLPSLVSRSSQTRAVALSSTTFQIATIVGPALGGLLYAAAGGTAAFVTAAACATLSAVCMVAMRTRFPRRPPPEERGLALLMSGVRYVLGERVLLGAISFDLVAVLLGGTVALMPIYARDILRVGASGLGALEAAPAVGAAIVAVLLSVRPLRRHEGHAMFGAVVVFGVATLVFGLSRSFLLSLAALAVLGAADMVSVVVRQSLVQLKPPDAMRGRVASVNTIFVGASNELGEFESGVTAAWLGAVRAVVVGGIGTLVVTGLWAGIFPELRKVDRLAGHEDG